VLEFTVRRERLGFWLQEGGGDEINLHPADDTSILGGLTVRLAHGWGYNPHPSWEFRKVEVSRNDCFLDSAPVAEATGPPLGTTNSGW